MLVLGTKKNKKKKKEKEKENEKVKTRSQSFPVATFGERVDTL